jgi:hypothetical protein
MNIAHPQAFSPSIPDAPTTPAGQHTGAPQPNGKTRSCFPHALASKLNHDASIRMAFDTMAEILSRPGPAADLPHARREPGRRYL